MIIPLITPLMKKYLPLFCIILFTACQPNSQEEVSEAKIQSDARPEYVMVIHGGAGAMSRDRMTDEMEKTYRSVLQEALNTGEAILKEGGSSMDAIEATIQVMENAPVFNAGKGAVFTSEATVELDASFMDGETLNAGAIAGVKTVKNPIQAARKVMEESVHVMLAGSGADVFAKEQGLEIVENSYFHTPRRLKQLQRMQENTGSKAQGVANYSEPFEKKYGTVGAVALDKAGNLAAGTSTGGMSNKRWGRVGDAPIIGAGTYADNNTCAVSCTGHGEYFIRNAIAYSVSARMAFGKQSLEEASNALIHEVLPPQGGTGGLIAVDKDGNIAMPFNTSGMFRGYVHSNGDTHVAIYPE